MTSLPKGSMVWYKNIWLRSCYPFRYLFSPTIIFERFKLKSLNFVHRLAMWSICIGMTLKWTWSWSR